jgi:hypothetical protein
MNVSYFPAHESRGILTLPSSTRLISGPNGLPWRIISFGPRSSLEMEIVSRARPAPSERPGNCRSATPSQGGQALKGPLEPLDCESHRLIQELGEGRSWEELATEGASNVRRVR